MTPVRLELAALRSRGALSIHGVTFPDLASFDSLRRNLGPEALALQRVTKLDDLNMGFVARKPVLGVSDKANFKPVSSAIETC